MDKPIIFNNNPIKTALEEGKVYHYCVCGRSKEQPFCDGAGHKGSSLGPLQFVTRATTQKWLCACKHTQNPPYCDGSHQKFSSEDIGTTGGNR